VTGWREDEGLLTDRGTVHMWRKFACLRSGLEPRRITEKPEADGKGEGGQIYLSSETLAGWRDTGAITIASEDC